MFVTAKRCQSGDKQPLNAFSPRSPSERTLHTDSIMPQRDTQLTTIPSNLDIRQPTSEEIEIARKLSMEIEMGNPGPGPISQSLNNHNIKNIGSINNMQRIQSQSVPPIMGEDNRNINNNNSNNNNMIHGESYHHSLPQYSHNNAINILPPQPKTSIINQSQINHHTSFDKQLSVDNVPANRTASPSVVRVNQVITEQMGESYVITHTHTHTHISYTHRDTYIYILCIHTKDT